MKTKKLKTKINSDVIIVDTEITNDLSPKWDYREADICTIGILKGNEIIVLQREKGDDLNQFKIVARDLLKDISNFSAFNYKFEQGAFSGFLGEWFEVEEIKPFRGKLFNKDRFFEELKKIKNIEDETNDSFSDGALVPKKYEEEKYDEIINHNINCLIKEAYIQKYKKEILEKFKGSINKDGWFEEKKKLVFDKSNWDKERATKYQIAKLLNNGFDYIKDNLHEINKLDASNKIENLNIKNEG